MNVSLTPELEEFIKKEVKSGMYESASEVIHAGLRLLRKDKGSEPRFITSSPEDLESKLLSGVKQLDEGKGISSNVAMKELHNRAKSRLHQNG